MTLAELEVHFKSFEATVGQDISLVRAFFTHVQSEEAKIESEINHLVSLGYTVLHKENGTTTDPQDEVQGTLPPVV